MKETILTGDAGVSDCWRTIGRPGAGTCPELPQHLLCRNCPTYSAAALRLLDRPAPADYVREWTTHLAAEARRASGATTSVFVFRLCSEWLALPTAVIEQITEPSRVHTLPHRTLPVRGVVSVRGELIVCVSLEALLGLSGQHAPAASPRLVVMSFDGTRVAFQPHEVHGVSRYDARELMAAPATLTKASGAHFTTGLFAWNGRSVGCLDASRFFSAVTRSLA
jgi:chemotaxis-related protein WspD